MAPGLEPLPEKIAIFDQFVSTQTQTVDLEVTCLGISPPSYRQTLVLREKVLSVSGDSFDIKTTDGKLLLAVHGSWISFSGRKKVSDAHGKHLFDIVKEHLHLHSTYAIEDTHRKTLVEVKSNIAVVGSKATATFTSSTGRAETVKTKGGWFDHSAEIVDDKTGRAVAPINRKVLSGKDLIFGQQTYAAEVAPGVDAALVAALCICFDEKNNESD